MSDSVANLRVNVALNAAALKSGAGAAISEVQRIKSAAMGAGNGSWFKGVGGSLRGVGTQLSSSFDQTGLLSSIGGVGALTGAGSAAGALALGTKLTEAVYQNSVASRAMMRDAGKMGVGVETFQELKIAAEKSGGSIEEVGGAIRRMKEAIGDAAGGDATKASLFKSLGLDPEQLRRMSTDKAFEATSKGIMSIGNAYDRAAVETKLFGKAGAEMEPIFASVADGLGKYKSLTVSRDSVYMNAQTFKGVKDATQLISKEMQETLANHLIFAGEVANMAGAYGSGDFSVGYGDYRKQISAQAAEEEKLKEREAQVQDNALRKANALEAAQEWQRSMRTSREDILEKFKGDKKNLDALGLDEWNPARRELYQRSVSRRDEALGALDRPTSSLDERLALDRSKLREKLRTGEIDAVHGARAASLLLDNYDASTTGNAHLSSAMEGNSQAAYSSFVNAKYSPQSEEAWTKRVAELAEKWFPEMVNAIKQLRNWQTREAK